MKCFRPLLSVLLMSLSVAALAQSNAQKSFDKLKLLAGSWGGTFEGKPVQISMRVTSTGNALMHEATQIGRTEDPITVFYLDGNRLLLTHYCDSGNRPRMTGKMMPDGNTLEFDFLDIASYDKTQFGHLNHVTITQIDANHHTEDWIFRLHAGQPPVRAHYDLQRIQPNNSNVAAASLP